jgi:uncharacterized membrane protein YgaE (UPF0421/DUF939 family)
MATTTEQETIDLQVNPAISEVQPEPIVTDTTSKTNIWLYIFIGVFALSIIGNVYLLIKNRSQNKRVVVAESQAERSKSDYKVLEEKVSTLTGENQELDKSLEDAFQNMTDKDILIASLNKENETLKEISSQVSKIENIRNNLNTQLDQLSISKKQLKEVQDNVNSTIVKKQNENKKITDQLK